MARQLKRTFYLNWPLFGEFWERPFCHVRNGDIRVLSETYTVSRYDAMTICRPPTLTCIEEDDAEVIVLSGGQSFIPSSIQKIKNLHAYIQENNFNVLLEVDGGVNINNAQEIRASGADVLVAGTAIFGSENYANTINLLRG